MNSKTARLGVAAAVVFAALLTVHHFTGSIDGATEVLAQITEAMKRVPWMHGTANVTWPTENEYNQNGRTEFWQSFDLGINVEIRPGGEIRLTNSKKKQAHVYSPAVRQITISRLTDDTNVMASGGSPHEILAKIVTVLSDVEGASMDRRVERRNDQKIEIITISVPRGEALEQWIFGVDCNTRLLRTMKLQGYMEDGKFVEVLDGTFDYPAAGPTNIYQAGAPRDARIVNELPDKVHAPQDLSGAAQDAYPVKEHLSKGELTAYYQANPLQPGQMEIRAGTYKDGISMSQFPGLSDYWHMEIATSVTHLAKSYHSPSAGRIRFDGSFDDIFVQYDVITRGAVSTKEKVQALLAKVGVQIVDSQADCAVWIALHDGRPLKPLSEIKCPVPGSFGVGTLSASYIFTTDDLLRHLGQHQDVIVENNTGIDPKTNVSHVIPNFKGEAGARLAEKWYLEYFGITFQKETRKMPVWTVRMAN
ncbi:MAG: hypothetical protein IH624_18345 [Phycisphaerae bacterium]|nr:hypothetical protein [Phycisphaerae bacterium]